MGTHRVGDYEVQVAHLDAADAAGRHLVNITVWRDREHVPVKMLKPKPATEITEEFIRQNIPDGGSIPFAAVNAILKDTQQRQ